MHVGDVEVNGACRRLNGAPHVLLEKAPQARDTRVPGALHHIAQGDVQHGGEVNLDAVVEVYSRRGWPTSGSRNTRAPAQGDGGNRFSPKPSAVRSTPRNLVMPSLTSRSISTARSRRRRSTRSPTHTPTLAGIFSRCTASARGRDGFGHVTPVCVGAAHWMYPVSRASSKRGDKWPPRRQRALRDLSCIVRLEEESSRPSEPLPLYMRAAIWLPSIHWHASRR